MSSKGTPTRYPGVTRLGPTRFRLRGRIRNHKSGHSIDLDKIVDAPAPDQANKLRSELLADLDAPRREATERMRLKAYAASWLRLKLPSLKASTRALYATVLDEHVLPNLGEHYVDGITTDDLLEWRDVQVSKPVRTKKDGTVVLPSPITVNCRIRIVRSLMKDAVEDLGLERDPTRRLGALRGGKNKRSCLTADELQRFLAAAKAHTPQWYPFFFTLAFSGMRFGEATALRWRDINEKEGLVRISVAQWQGHVDDTKTGVVRSVPLFPELAAVLEQQRARQRAEALRRARRAKVAALDLVSGSDDVLVFSTRDGVRHMHNTAPRKALLACLRAAGIDRHLTVHGLRHTFNDLLRRSQADGIVVRSMTGHSTVEMTEHYSHVDMGEKRAAIAGVVRLVAAQGPTAASVGDAVGDLDPEPAATSATS